MAAVKPPIEFTVTLTGTLPLIMHSARMVDPLDPIGKEHKRLTDKKSSTRTDADNEEIQRLHFLGSLYMDAEIGPYIPGANFQRCLFDASKLRRFGPKFERGVFIDTDVNPLGYSGPRAMDELWADESYRFRHYVKQGIAKNSPRVIKTRPIFRQWRCQAHGILDLNQLDLGDLELIAADAGSFIGIGDWRPRYGRFTAIVEKA